LMKTLLFFTLALVAVYGQDKSKTIAANIAANPSLSTLNAVITNPSYKAVYDALNNPASKLTLFAPNDNAFTVANVNASNVPLVTDVLLYHVLPVAVSASDLKGLQFPATILTDAAYVNVGANKSQVVGVEKYSTSTGTDVYVNYGIPGALSIDTAEVVQADLISSNGYIHIINKVETFPNPVSTTAQEAGLYLLIQALQKTGLVSTVDTTASLTIFAPTDAAFIKAGWDKLTTAQLTTVLTYHVVPAIAYSTELTNGETVPTLNGNQKLRIDLNNGRVTVVGSTNSADVIIPNALTKNGVVHIINQVLVPSNL